MNVQPTNPSLSDCPSMQLADHTDNELLVLYVDHRSEAAFNQLVARHSAMVLNVCLSVVSDRNRAEDAFQATFLALIRHARRLRNSPSFAGWLYRVAFRAALKSLKQPRLESQQTEMVEPYIEIDPLHQLATREVIQSVVNELNHIPKRQREALTLFYFEQLSRAEIAARMDSTPGTVKALLQRGKQLLKRRLLRKGLVPAMVVLSVRAFQRSAEATSISSLVAMTVATCVKAGPVAATAPSNLINLLNMKEWTMLTSNSIAAKTGFTATGILAVIAIPLSLLVGSVPEQNERAANSIAIHQRNGNGTPVAFAVSKIQEDEHREQSKNKSAPKTNPEQLQKLVEKLAAEVKKLEEKQKQLMTKQKQLSQARIKLAMHLLENNLKELRKFASTAPGKSALVEIYIQQCLAIDRKTSEVFVADSRTRNLIYMNPDGTLISVMSTIDAGGGPNSFHSRITNKKTRKILSTIQQELGRIKASDIRVKKYPGVLFHISEFRGNTDESAANYGLMVESSVKY